ncbi:VTT domain-containing protein [Pelagibacteraceae bacterium]|jgi:uncharacterized membrane protein YdjX (TVP38/TMEM64 family)|nr:VTT domain-containing protein [Pelagibacteraceae bacterium]|tara:strand:- start:611 stop:1327 length:717 start_codon:yes stop_codon:yes gene_type:complete
MDKKLKLIIAFIYMFCFVALFCVLFSYLDLKDLSSYSYIKVNSEALKDLKNSNLLLFSIIFLIFSIIWILLLGFASPLAILSGFLFGQWYGTIISIISFTIGCTLLYLLANLYFKNLIVNYLENRISKYKNLFNKNEFYYFMLFRFAGGAGLPFCIQNVLPVIFDMKVKNYFYASLIGLIPSIFVINALGAGIEKLIGNSDEIKYQDIISSPSIYWPLAGFVVILIISIFIQKKIFKK